MLYLANSLLVAIINSLYLTNYILPLFHDKNYGTGGIFVTVDPFWGKKTSILFIKPNGSTKNKRSNKNYITTDLTYSWFCSKRLSQ